MSLTTQGAILDLFEACGALGQDRRMRRYEHAFSKIPVRLLTRAIDAALAHWERGGVPPIGFIHKELAAQSGADELRYGPRAPWMRQRPGPEEKEAIRLLWALAKRGVIWHGACRRFVGSEERDLPDDPTAAELERRHGQEIAWMLGMQHSPSVEMIQAAWQEYGSRPEVPSPKGWVEEVVATMSLPF